MHATDVKNLNWISVTDWGNLQMTSLTFDGYKVGKKDIKNFAESVFRDVARKLNITYKELYPIFKEEKQSFYSACQKLFGQHLAFDKNDDNLIKLQSMLMIPDATNISSVEKILADFATLTDTEKLEVL